VDNFVGAQRTMLSTEEPGTPVVSRGHLRHNNHNGQQPYKPHGVHLNPAVRLSKGWGPPLIRCTGTSVYGEEGRAQLMGQLPVALRGSVEFLGYRHDHLEQLKELAAAELIEESHRHRVCHLLETIPGMGPIRVAQAVPIVVTPHRFRTKRQFWSYCGFGVEERGGLRPGARAPAHLRRDRGRSRRPNGWWSRRARISSGHNGSRGSIRRNPWSQDQPGVAISWLYPLAEPKEVMAPDALMDAWFPGNEGRPVETSPLTVGRARVPSSSTQRSRIQRSRSRRGGRSAASLSSEQGKCVLDTAFYGWGAGPGRTRSRPDRAGPQSLDEAGAGVRWPAS